LEAEVVIYESHAKFGILPIACAEEHKQIPVKSIWCMMRGLEKDGLSKEQELELERTLLNTTLEV